MNLQELRREYARAELDISTVETEPMAQFQKWFQDVLKAEIEEPNAMTLATVGADGQPSARIVLLKACDDRGFVFFTNYQSHKGRDLEENPKACLNFFWPCLERQIRIEGHCEKIPKQESEAYFKSRPRGAQIGAWASNQSQVIESRSLLQKKFQEKSEQIGDHAIELPPAWGGYVLHPTLFEFWQGRPNRLHDRICFTLLPVGGWSIERLAP